MRSTIKYVDQSYPIVERRNGVMRDHFRIFVLEVVNSGLLIGTGSPDTVVEAAQGRFYMDEEGLAGSILWLKQLPDISGDRTRGWVAIG